jgi:hypothetical protein
MDLFIEYGIHLDEALSWLEKQGKNNMGISESVKQKLEDNLSKALEKETPESLNKFLDEQKPCDKAEPKFHEGDWIITNKNHIWYVDKTPETTSYLYRLIDQYGNIEVAEFEVVDEKARLWTIQDAKDGDVIAYVTDEGDLWIMIYQSLYEPYVGHVHYHALLVNDNFSDKGTCCICIDDLKPATKEQRDTLERAITNAGYRWDKENLKLEKI